MEDSKTVKTHQPCHLCGSSNAGALYDDGHFYCFSCNGYEKGMENTERVVQMDSYKTAVKKPKDVKWSDRYISDAVRDYYEVSANDSQVRFPTTIQLGCVKR